MCMNAQNKSNVNWDDIRIAYHVARLGTLSAAARYLDIHHATVIRKIDALEQRLGSKLFHRHPRGYTPTEAGQELMRVGLATDDQLTQLMGQLRGQEKTVSGELILTTVSGLSEWLTPLLVGFQRAYPDVPISLTIDDRHLQMEYGEAHIALRAGAKPQDLDNVVQRLCQFPAALFAHKTYVEKYGLLKGEADFQNHKFVVSSSNVGTAPCQIWERKHIPKSSIAYQASEVRSVSDAICAGAGIGFLTLWAAEANADLVQMTPDRSEWGTNVWMVTHSALHRTAKIQTFLSFLKQQVQTAIKHGPELID